MTMLRCDRIDAGRLHLIADRSAGLDDDGLVAATAAAVAGGVDVVHARDTSGGARALAELTRRLLGVVGPARLIVNDRVDVALALDADGVQIGRRGLGLADARRIAPGLLLGASIHSVAELTDAAPADWLLLGTIYASRSHPGVPGAGPALIARARAITRQPIVAIGGIGVEHVYDVVAAGADGVAVISAILGDPAPEAAAARLRAAIDAALAARALRSVG